MTTNVTLSLPDEVYGRIERLAERTGQHINNVASVVLGLSLMEMDTRPIATLSDVELLVLADSMMDAEQNARFSLLQSKGNEGTLTEAERSELNLLLEIYRAGQLRKTQALIEAIKRGLRQQPD